MLCREEGPTVDLVYGLNGRDVIRAVRIAERIQAELMAAWEELHGESHAD